MMVAARQEDVYKISIGGKMYTQSLCVCYFAVGCIFLNGIVLYILYCNVSTSITSYIVPSMKKARQLVKMLFN